MKCGRVLMRSCATSNPEPHAMRIAIFGKAVSPNDAEALKEAFQRVLQLDAAPWISQAYLSELNDHMALPDAFRSFDGEVPEGTELLLAFGGDGTALELVGVSLWQFATDEIRRAEADLADSDWWSVQMPAPRIFQTSERRDAIRISAGGIMWERLYLSDGTPVRLVTGV